MGLLTALLGVALLLSGCVSGVEYAAAARRAELAGRPQEIVANARQAVEADPAYAPGWYWLGIGSHKMQQWDESIRALEKFLSLRPSGVQVGSAHSHLGKAYAEKGQGERAIEHHKRAVELDASNAVYQNDLGLAYVVKREHDLAVLHLRRSVEINPKDANSQRNLGHAYFKRGNYAAGDYDRAVEALRRSVELGHARAAVDLKVALDRQRQERAKRETPPVAAPAPRETPPAAVATAPPPRVVEPPKIALNYPPENAQVDTAQIVVLGLVTAAGEVDSVQVTVNGVPVAMPRDIAVTGRGQQIRAPVTLQPGRNVIEVTASDRTGNLVQAVRAVTRVIPPPAAPGASGVATPPAAPPRIANRWAVVIGVGEYEKSTVPRLRYAVRDAEAMHQFLVTDGGFAKERVVLLTDRTATKPTLINVKRALGDFLARRAGRDDMVLIYFAGHGAPEVDVTGAETDGLAKYLVPRDGDPDSLYTTALPMDEIQRIFARIQAERIVLLLDTCYSGTAGGRTFARQQVRSGIMNDQFLERLTRSRGRVILSASGANEVALEVPALGHGLFTYYVLEGMRGKADRNRDGIVTVSELYEYVEEQVEQRARTEGGRQRPIMKGEIEGSLPLVRTKVSARPPNGP